MTGPGLAAGGLADGELLLGELNCVGCHQAPPAVKESLFVKQPPLLGQGGPGEQSEAAMHAHGSGENPPAPTMES